jgi:ubiquinone/menaquinone biosynthesis C-methylase UbiE
LAGRNQSQVSEWFQDHYSNVAASYARYRPRYPQALFEHLAALAPARDLAWDCATGNGQAAAGLAAHFKRVVATDASHAQIANAQPHPGVDYRVAPAEQSGLATDSVDLISVAQALHWFDLPRFFAEARRVLRAKGVLAAWCYGQMQIPNPDAQRALDKYYAETVGPYWPPERRLIEAGYRTIAFPFEKIRAPRFTMKASFTLEELAGYLGTWSATRRYIQATGQNPVPSLARELASAWGDGGARQEIAWPLSLRIGRK